MYYHNINQPNYFQYDVGPLSCKPKLNTSFELEVQKWKIAFNKGVKDLNKD